MDKQEIYLYDIMDVCLLAGKIMLQSGAETYRVEDTMVRIAHGFGGKESQAYVTPTGIVFSIESDTPTKTKLLRITERTTDLYKVTLVNSVSRKIAGGDLSVEGAYHALKEIENSSLTFPLFVKIFAAAMASGCFLIMFNGPWSDFLPAFIAGGVGFWSFVYIQGLIPIRFFAEFVAAAVIGSLSVLFVNNGWGFGVDKIIIASVMPLVPGLLLTNAVRDLVAGHFVSGLSKGAEALLTAFAIGSGIATILSFL